MATRMRFVPLTDDEIHAVSKYKVNRDRKEKIVEILKKWAFPYIGLRIISITGLIIFLTEVELHLLKDTFYAAVFFGGIAFMLFVLFADFGKVLSFFIRKEATDHVSKYCGTGR